MEIKATGRRTKKKPRDQDQTRPQAPGGAVGWGWLGRWWLLWARAGVAGWGWGLASPGLGLGLGLGNGGAGGWGWGLGWVWGSGLDCWEGEGTGKVDAIGARRDHACIHVCM